MVIEVISNQDSILDFPKYLHTFWPVKLLAADWLLADMTILKIKCALKSKYSTYVDNSENLKCYPDLI